MMVNSYPISARISRRAFEDEPKIIFTANKNIKTKVFSQHMNIKTTYTEIQS